jgi:hypothetical protein
MNNKTSDVFFCQSSVLSHSFLYLYILLSFSHSIFHLSILFPLLLYFFHNSDFESLPLLTGDLVQIVRCHSVNLYLCNSTVFHCACAVSPSAGSLNTVN